MQENEYLHGVHERGVIEVSDKLYGKVTQYHAQIGASVKKSALNELEWKLLAEAKDLFHRSMYEEALNTFTHCLAVTEKTRSTQDQAVRGAIVHNIASCLHHLGELEAAQEYYEQAISAFKRAETPMLEKIMYGDTNKRRVEFVKERLVDISWGRKPDLDKYLDENARKQPVPPLPQGVQTGNASGLSKRWATDEPPPPEARRPGWMDSADDGYSNDADAYTPYNPDAHYSSRANDYRDEYGGDRYGGDRYGGDRYAGDRYGGDRYGGDRYGGDRYGGDSYGGDSYGGDRYGGDGYAGAGAREGQVARGGEPAEEEEELDDEVQEQARKQWLDYYMQKCEWDKAEELVVTADEREDLAYLKGRQQRLSQEGRRGPADRFEQLPGAARLQSSDARPSEDLSELNDAAVAAQQRHQPRHHQRDKFDEEDEDGML